MRTRAAVAVAAGKPLEIMEVNLAGPKATWGNFIHVTVQDGGAGGVNGSGSL